MEGATSVCGCGGGEAPPASCGVFPSAGGHCSPTTELALPRPRFTFRERHSRRTRPPRVAFPSWCHYTGGPQRMAFTPTELQSAGTRLQSTTPRGVGLPLSGTGGHRPNCHGARPGAEGARKHLWTMLHFSRSQERNCGRSLGALGQESESLLLPDAATGYQGAQGVA